MATPAEILSDAECVVCAGNASMFEVFAIQILKQITGMTQAEIEAESSCFICYGISQSQAAMLVLLNAIAEGGAGGAAGLLGVVDPNGVVTPDAAGQFYTNTANDTYWQAWDATNSNWHQFV